MFYSYKNECFTYTGRWSECENAETTTAPGSYFEFKFKGKTALLKFDMTWNAHPYPHLWIIVDNGIKTEATAESFIHIEAQEDCVHSVKIIYKSAVEMHQRWHYPLIGKISFLGVDVCELLPAEKPNKKTIEFVGDSITEGVLIEENLQDGFTNDQFNRVFQDDSTATYAALTAKNLDLIQLNMGYGAVGVTHGGAGGVPSADEAYPYCFAGYKVEYPSPDYILINHGANDMYDTAENYLCKYKKLIDVVREVNPTSKLISLSAFCGAHATELGEFIEKYNSENGTDILFINSTGWVPVEPLHPAKDGHAIIAEKLTKILKKELNL